MELIVIRHGTASWDAEVDSERVLTARGETEVRAASDWLRQSGWQPQQLWHSPYVRAQQTANIVNRLWHLDMQEMECLTPDTEFADLEMQLQRAELDRLLVVGHNPLLSNVLAHWQGEKQAFWGLQPGSMALVTADIFSQGTASVKWLRHYPSYDHNAR